MTYSPLNYDCDAVCVVFVHLVVHPLQESSCGRDTIMDIAYFLLFILLAHESIVQRPSENKTSNFHVEP